MTHSPLEADIATALRRSQAFARVLSQHVLSLIAVTKSLGAPDAATLVAACEMSLGKAWQASEAAAAVDDARQRQPSKADDMRGGVSDVMGDLSSEEFVELISQPMTEGVQLDRT